MEELIIRLLSGVIIILIFAIALTVYLLKHENAKTKERCAELERQNKKLRKNYNAIYARCNELYNKYQKQRLAERIANAVIENNKPR